MSVQLVSDALTSTELDARRALGDWLLTPAEIIVSLDARFQIVSDGAVVCDMVDFPVVELARALRLWAEDDNPSDFEFDSMSFEEPGMVWIRGNADGRQIGWEWAGAGSTPMMSSDALRTALSRFVALISDELRRLGLDPALLLG